MPKLCQHQQDELFSSVRKFADQYCRQVFLCRGLLLLFPHRVLDQVQQVLPALQAYGPWVAIQVQFFDLAVQVGLVELVELAGQLVVPFPVLLILLENYEV